MGEAWHAEPLRGTPTRQPHTQPEARELLASAWANLSDGVGPSRDRASDDTAQNAASSCSGSDETGPPGRKEKPRSRPRPAHHEISIPAGPRSGLTRLSRPPPCSHICSAQGIEAEQAWRDYRMDIFKVGKRLGRKPALWRRHESLLSTMARQNLRQSSTIAITQRDRHSRAFCSLAMAEGSCTSRPQSPTDARH